MEISEKNFKNEIENENKKYNNGMLFTDCFRRIDFVLVYQRKDESRQNILKRNTFLRTLIREGLEIEIQDDSGHLYPTSDIENESSRAHSVNNSPSHRSNLVFIKIYATWKTLCRYAEIMKIRKPMLNLGIDYEFNRKSFLQRLFEKFDFLKVFNIDEDQLKPLPRGFTWPFSKSKKYLFDIPKEKSTFFTTTERSLIVNYILRRASYRHISGKCEEITNLDILEEIVSKKSNNDEFVDEDQLELQAKKLSFDVSSNDKINMDFGIAKLISDGAFESAYILHEKPLIEIGTNEDNLRNILYKQWGRMRNIFRLQPIDHVRLYFGEKVAFYFAWLGYYTYWLLPISFLGVIITIYNLAYTSTDIVVNEISHGSNITMCPLMCSEKRCIFPNLSKAYYRFFITRILDNGATVVLAIIMSIWASLFLEMWKRQQNKLAYKWNVHDMEYEDEPPRPEFVALLDKHYPKKINQISGDEEPFIPFWRQRIPVMFFTYSTVLFSIILALASLAGIIIYKLVMLPFAANFDSVGLNVLIACSASLISLIVIMILTMVYSRVAVWLTDLEHHRTQSQYDNSVTLKLYFLEFINNYSSIFYIGFIQQYTQPMHHRKLYSRSPIKPQGCAVGGCLLELSMQLAFIMIGKQIISHIKEYSIPRLCSTIKKRKLQKMENKIIFLKELDKSKVNEEEEPIKDATVDIIINSQAEEVKTPQELIRCYADNILLDPGPRPLFGEYIEMLIQFGFITIFIPAFPLAPLLALINNLLEIRSDAIKFVRALRRPIAQRVKDIGIWIHLLSIVAQIAVKSNAILIAFSTTYIDRLVYKFFYSTNGSLDGFLEFSMSYMESTRFNSTSGNVNSAYCRYMAYRYPPWEQKYIPYGYTSVFWQILAFKFIFIYLFENLVSLFMTVISVVIPDVPDKLRTSMRREAKLTNDIILKAELLRHKDHNATRLVAESFRKTAIISKRVRGKPKTKSLVSKVLLKSGNDSSFNEQST